MRKLQIALVLLLSLFVVVQPVAADWSGGGASGNGVEPVFDTELPGGNKECEALGYAYGVKIDANAPNGTYPIETAGIVELQNGTPAAPDENVTISNSDNYTFDWSSSFSINAVVVKAGSEGSNVYYYPSGSTGDSNLHSVYSGDGPDNPGTIRTVSHVNFCWNEAPPETGDLQVTKVVDWNGVDPELTQTFEVCVTGDTVTYGPVCKDFDYDGDTLTWEGLEPGEYTVSETDPGSEWTVVVESSPVTVVANETASVTVTNTHEPPPPETGDLQVTKVVNWGCVYPEPTQTFEICISGPSYPAGDCQTVDYDGGVVSWEGLILGVYTVSETDPGPGWAVVVESSPVTVVANETASVTVTNSKEKPTAITMPSSSFVAAGDTGQVTLSWETGAELDNAGFNVYRATSSEGPWTQINEALIAAQGDAFAGASYSFADAPGYGIFYYQLEDVDLYGATSIHGPVMIDLGSPIRAPYFRPSLPEF